MKLKIEIGKLIWLSSILLFVVSTSVFAQTNYDVTLKNTILGAEKIGTVFTKPVTTAITTALVTGWSNSGKALQPWQIEVRAGGSWIWVPTNDLSFDMNNLPLPANFQYETTNPFYPTILGGKNQNTNRIAIFNEDNERLARLTMPSGINRSNVPVPEFQIGTGLPFKSALFIRFIPSLNLGNYGKTGTFGFALQKQLFHKILKKQREFSISVLGGYNQIHYNYSLIEAHRIVENPDLKK